MKTQNAKCENCGKVSTVAELLQPGESVWFRLDPGSEVPAGECRSCGAFAYLIKPPKLGRALKRVKRAHDALSEAAEDPDGSNDTEHDKAVELMEALNAYYPTAHADKEGA